MSEPGPVDAAQDTEALENDQFLAYVGDELPWTIKALWAVSLVGFAWYTWTWYLPDLWAAMGWG